MVGSRVGTYNKLFFFFFVFSLVMQNYFIQEIWNYINDNNYTPYFFKYPRKGEFQICPRMDFDNNLYDENLRNNNYKNEIILFLNGFSATGGAP